MKLLRIFLVCAVSSVAEAVEWNDLSVLHINREKPRATMMNYPTEQEAQIYDRTTSPWFKSLNGLWKFNWVRSPLERPVNFFEPAYDVSDWNNIPVPANWDNAV